MRIYPLDQIPTAPKTGTPKNPIKRAFAGYLGKPLGLGQVASYIMTDPKRGPEGATYPVKPIMGGRPQINDRGPKGVTYPAKPTSDVLDPTAINIRDPGTYGVQINDRGSKGVTYPAKPTDESGAHGSIKDILQTASTAVPAHISSFNPARGAGGQGSMSSIKPARKWDKYGRNLQMDSRISKEYSIATPAKPGEDVGATVERFTKSGPADDYKGRFSSFISAGGGITGMPQLASNGINRVYDYYSKKIGA